MNFTSLQHDILALINHHLVPLLEALRLETFYDALGQVCRRLLGVERVSVLTFHYDSPRARLRYSTEADLVPHLGRLLPFDEGSLCDTLRAGFANEVAPDEPPLRWRTLEGTCTIEAYAIRPLLFQGEPYGALLFHQRPKSEPGPDAITHTSPEEQETSDPLIRSVESPVELYMDLIAQAAGAALMRCLLDEERAAQVVDSKVRLEAITRMGRALSGLDLKVLLQRVMDVALSAVNGQVGSIVLARDGRLETAVEWGLEHAVAEAIRYSNGRPVMEEVYRTRLPVLLTDVSRNRRICLECREVNIESYLCVPLYTNRRTLGVINIVNRVGGRALSDRDMDLLLTITNLASAALENALLHEAAVAKERIDTQLKIASDIQRGLLPTTAPSLPGLDLAGWNHPCEAVGGDYFDFLPLDDGRLAVVVGDVSGHGLGPALLMTSARAALRSLVSCNIRLERVMAHLNRLLTDQILTPGTFITMVLAAVDGYERNLVFTNAGHPLPLVFRASSRSLREPQERGLVLGVDPDADYPLSDPIHLDKGDIVALYTDGILEATNPSGEAFGKERLTRTLVAHRDRSASEIIEAIRTAVVDFTGRTPPADDLTLVLIKAL